MNQYALEVINLTKVFGTKKVIDQVNFTVKCGDVYGFLGPNGAGKTTIIRMILNLVHPDDGQVNIYGTNTQKMAEQAFAKVGAIVETPSFYEHLTGRQNLQLMANYNPEIKQERIGQVLEIVSLTHRAGEKVKNYSLGMKQRLGIARALLNDPQLVFLDEPTNGLDPEGIIEIRTLITRLAKEQGITFFITTHLLHEVEQICNQLAILHNGQIIAQGSVEELLQKDYETVEVHTVEKEKAAKLIDGLEFVRALHPTDQGLEVELSKGYSGQLITLLSSEKVQLDYLVPKKETLEQYFIQMTKGEKRHV